jgi:hypothetical protein
MIEQLPEGNSIGWMQAPPQWIFTHTVRFVGIVRIVIQDGEGFILIKRGKPVYYYFKHGRIELKGNSALDYFNSHPIIEFNLCKYTPEEFALAMKICHIEEDALHELPESPKNIAREPVTPSRVIPVPRTEPIAEQAADQEQTVEQEQPSEATELAGRPQPAEWEEPAQPAEQEQLPEEEPVEPAVQERPAPVLELPPLPVERQIHRSLFRTAEYPVDIPATVPQPILLEESDIKLIGQIKKLNGVVAISVFNNERNILLMGDVDIEPLLKIARSMLATTRKISPLVE